MSPVGSAVGEMSIMYEKNGGSNTKTAHFLDTNRLPESFTGEKSNILSTWFDYENGTRQPNRKHIKGR